MKRLWVLYFLKYFLISACLKKIVISILSCGLYHQFFLSLFSIKLYIMPYPVLKCIKFVGPLNFLIRQMYKMLNSFFFFFFVLMKMVILMSSIKFLIWITWKVNNFIIIPFIWKLRLLSLLNLVFLKFNIIRSFTKMIIYIN